MSAAIFNPRVMRGCDDEISPGSIWRNEMLGSVAVYEVVRSRGELIEVKVVRAPGLVPGRTVMLTRAAVAVMQRVDSPTQKQGAGDGGAPLNPP